MTFSIDAENAMPFGGDDPPAPAPRQISKPLWEQFKAMSKAMVEQEGLLNHAQAGILLNVSTKRVTELVRFGKLTRFDFVGRTYVSFKEVRERCEQEVKAGRPQRKLGKKVANALKAVARMDLPQLVVEGLTDYETKTTPQKPSNEQRS